MHPDQVFYEQLLSEIERRRDLSDASLAVREAAIELQEARAAMKGVARLLPFIPSRQKAVVEEKNLHLREVENRERVCQDDLVDAWEQLDVLTYSKLERDKDAALVRSEDVKACYDVARQRLDHFQTTVEEFLKSLGEARGAMSACYNTSTNEYSAAAKERIQVAIASGQRMDEAIDLVNELNDFFCEKTQGTRYAGIEMPFFRALDYEGFVRQTTEEPIGRAQMEFEKMLDACEQLHREDLAEAHSAIDEAEALHRQITGALVRERWQREQAKTFLCMPVLEMA